MTREQFIQRKIKTWQKILQLNDWTITFELQDLDEMEQGITWRFTERTAHIAFSNHTTRDRLEKDIAHELSHLILAKFDRYVEDWVWPRLTKKEKQTYGETHNKLLNEVIDHYLNVVRAMES
ncbi:MAG: hypothetical protein HZC40_20610 [Chloroflexi bacterium]|nr:hypothetical protein [Chloroflexota bacterium]